TGRALRGNFWRCQVQIWSSANYARDIYRNARNLTDKLLKAGVLNSTEAEAKFRELVTERLRSASLSVPKKWSQPQVARPTSQPATPLKAAAATTGGMTLAAGATASSVPLVAAGIGLLALVGFGIYWFFSSREG